MFQGDRVASLPSTFRLKQYRLLHEHLFVAEEKSLKPEFGKTGVHNLARMERVLSNGSGLDDLVGGIWRLSGQNLPSLGMGRTDSEAAFQEFLKRIPSASNLAAIAGSTGQLGGGSGFDAGVLPQAPLPSSATDVLTAGIPRVSSLDFLARLVTQQPFANGGVGHPNHLAQPLSPVAAPIKPEPIPAGARTGPLALADLATLSATLSSVPASAAINPAAAAAAALQLQSTLNGVHHLAAAHQRLPTPPGPTHQHHSHHHVQPPAPAPAHTSNTHAVSQSTSRSGPENGGEMVDKNEARRARRMLSNRESARRSRRRKQEHVSRLEDQLQEALDSKKTVTEQMQTLERRCTSIEEENKRLREENERLRDELRFLRTELTDRKDRNGWRRHHDEDEEHSAKRIRGGQQQDSNDAPVETVIGAAGAAKTSSVQQS